MSNLRSFLLTVAFASLATNLLAAPPKPKTNTGAGSFLFTDERGNADRPLIVWTYAPKKLRPMTPIVFVMHGARRNGEDYRNAWIDHAEKRGFLLIVPEFSEKAYPNEAYQRGNLFGADGKPVPKSKWAFTAIEHLFDHVKEMTGNTSSRYSIYGHSGGGQFVQRLVLFLPEARFARAIAANPGYYTMPDFAAPFPYGLKGTPATKESLKQSFGRSFVLLLGKEDTKRDDPNFRKTPESDAQGLTRFERGQTYFSRCQEVAKSFDMIPKWKLELVPGAGHSDKQMSATAVNALFR